MLSLKSAFNQASANVSAVVQPGKSPESKLITDILNGKGAKVPVNDHIVDRSQFAEGYLQNNDANPAFTGPGL